MEPWDAAACPIPTIGQGSASPLLNYVIPQ